ncbi:hypothetical protein [Geomonas oryzae]|uniref:hypothetical protein n=1 Tax=Geomonas oryzae TaxID=2364273 RepID=UPI00100BA359|nr:hypothetical protein [Geomonas oryzae]
MKQGTLVLLMLVACAVLINVEEARSEQTMDYNKIFKGEAWAGSTAFLQWARPLAIKSSANVPCSDRILRRLTDSAENVLFCRQVAELKVDGLVEPAELVWAIVRKATPSSYGLDCNAGIVFLDNKQMITEDGPSDCEYSLGIVDPAYTPIMVFLVKLTGEMGIVFDGHGAECGGRAVLKQEGRIFKQVHELYWTCEH